MTREEAIKLIEHISIAFVPTDQYGDYDDPRPYEEALDMAIEALSDEAVQGDLIKRQDAIEAIAKRIYHIEDGNENDALRKAICDIDALPSVNAIPYDSTVTLNSPTIIKATSTDLIGRQDAFRTYQVKVCHDVACSECQTIDADGTCRIEAWLKDIPSADRPTGEVDAVAIYEKAEHDLEHNKITLGEFEKRIEPLKHLYYDRPTSEWILAPSVYKGKLWHLCPLCRHVQLEKTNYCPDCGVKMGGRAND